MRFQMGRRSASGKGRSTGSAPALLPVKIVSALLTGAALPTFIALGVLIALPACGVGETNVTPAQAFALSASALSGSDRYRLKGEITVRDSREGRTERIWYAGEVTGHGHLSLQWSDRPPTAVQSKNSADIPNGNHAGSIKSDKPLSLLNAMQNANVNVTYAELNARDKNVRLRIELSEADARKRIANSLQGELDRLDKEWRERKLNAAQRRQGEAELRRARHQLAAILPTLQVQTVCYWTADRKTWFPRSMLEQTEIVYQWQGESVKESREAATYFLR